MDYVNFQVEHNTGYFSLTWSNDSWNIFRFDIWHHLKVLLLGIIFFPKDWKRRKPWVQAIVIAFLGQVLIYNIILKSLF